jgi:hypothetical protein
VAGRTIVNPRLTATLRAVSEGLMPDSYAIVRDTAIVDTGGGTTTTEHTVGVGDCRVRAGRLPAAEAAIADRLGWDVPYAVDLPHATSLTPSDRLLINSSRTFEIGAVVDTGTWALTKVAICREQG